MILVKSYNSLIFCLVKSQHMGYANMKEADAQHGIQEYGIIY